MAELQPISIQQLVRASGNANALDVFVNADAATMVFRPAADPIESLEYWRDYMNSLSTGKNASIESMTVATGAAGTSATVVTGGTHLARTFALTIPRGDKGLDGSYTLKAYSTYALMTAAAANIPANTSVNVTNDTDTTKNGMYVYNGIAFTKSAYDPLKDNFYDLTGTYNDNIDPLISDINGRSPVWLDAGRLNFAALHPDAIQKIDDAINIDNTAVILETLKNNNTSGAAYPINSDGATLTKWKAKASKIQTGSTSTQLRLLLTRVSQILCNCHLD